MSENSAQPRSNPFATRFVAPGKIPWIGDASPEELSARFRSSESTAMLLVGPHGSGKSTLLMHLAKALGCVRLKMDVHGRLERIPAKQIANCESAKLIHLQVRREGFSPHHRSSPNTASLPPEKALQSIQQNWRSGDILLLDGLEQLRPWSRARLLFQARRAEVRILATSHRQHLGYSELHQTATDLVIARKIVAELMHCESPSRDQKKIDLHMPESFAKHRGNMREVLMDLYDCMLDSENPPQPLLD